MGGVSTESEESEQGSFSTAASAVSILEVDSGSGGSSGRYDGEGDETLACFREKSNEIKVCMQTHITKLCRNHRTNPQQNPNQLKEQVSKVHAGWSCCTGHLKCNDEACSSAIVVFIGIAGQTDGPRLKLLPPSICPPP